MKAIRFLLGTIMMSAIIFCTDTISAQHRSGGGRTSHRTESRSSNSSQQRSHRSAQSRSNQGRERNVSKNKNTSVSRQNGMSRTERKNSMTTKERNSGNKNKTTVKTNNKSVHKSEKARVGSTSTRNNQMNRDNRFVTKGNRSVTGKENNRTATTRQSNDKNRNQTGNNHRGGSSNNSDSYNKGDKGNSSHGHNNNARPDDNRNHNNGHGYHSGGSSAPKPGTRPHNDYKRKDYRPPRTGGGHWGAPPRNDYHWSRPLPPPPPRYRHVRRGVPTIGSVLGLAFGTFIDYGINALLGNGYTVLGYLDNAIYLSNVTQFGYIWPDVQMFYSDGLLANARMQYWTTMPDLTRYNSLYRQLCTLYGSPVTSSYINGMNSISWWGGNNTGYITLEYGFGNSDMGYGGYYTTLTYGGYY